MIRTFSAPYEWHNLRNEFAKDSSVGFVPTMGALHDGHLNLVRQAASENEIVVVSIYVNPTQFDNKADLEKYPQEAEKDILLIQNMLAQNSSLKQKQVFVFLPTYKTLYPDGYRYRLTESEFSKILCGAHRPGHFDGVLTVVMKLLNIVQADRAYFGEKDYQQLTLVSQMADAFFLKTKIVASKTVREPDGLAMSSRNRRLTIEQRNFAQKFPALLQRFDLSTNQIAEQLTALGFKVDYVSDWQGRRLGAVFLGDVRLIDNFEIKKGGL